MAISVVIDVEPCFLEAVWASQGLVLILVDPLPYLTFGSSNTLPGGVCPFLCGVPDSLFTSASAARSREDTSLLSYCRIMGGPLIASEL